MKYRITEYEDLKQRVENMTLPELLRCVICPDITIGLDEIPQDQTSFFMHPAKKEDAYAVSKKVNEGKNEKTLIVSDMEYGAGGAIIGATAFPSLWAAARTKDESLAYKMGIIGAKEGLEAGYHWTFGPCVDILGNHENPIVSVRCAGDNTETVIKYAGTYFRGLQDGGMMATLKHFPGDGYCKDDQHITTTKNPLSKREWDKSFGKVYKKFIDEGARVIMPGHISLPCYDEIDPSTGLYPPATVSKNLLTKLLRNKLGFEGIIVSDAMTMGGFCNYINLYDGIAAFLEAGGDCPLYVDVNDKLFHEMEKRISNGRLQMKTLKKAAYRMLCFSRDYFEKTLPFIPNIPMPNAKEVVQEYTEKSVEVICDRVALLPIKESKSKRVLHVVLSIPGTRDSAFERTSKLTNALKEYFLCVDEVVDPGQSKIKQNIFDEKYDLIICSILNEMSYGLNNVKLSGKVARNMMGGWMRYGVPAVFISFSDPFFCETFESAADTVINTYGYNEYTIDAIIKRILN